MKQHTLSLWLGGVLFGLLTSAAQAEPWTLEHTDRSPALLSRTLRQP